MRVQIADHGIPLGGERTSYALGPSRSDLGRQLAAGRLGCQRVP